MAWKKVLRKLTILLANIALDWLFARFKTKEEAYNFVADKINDLYKKKK